MCGSVSSAALRPPPPQCRCLHCLALFSNSNRRTGIQTPTWFWVCFHNGFYCCQLPEDFIPYFAVLVALVSPPKLLCLVFGLYLTFDKVIPLLQTEGFPLEPVWLCLWGVPLSQPPCLFVSILCTLGAVWCLAAFVNLPSSVGNCFTMWCLPQCVQHGILGMRAPNSIYAPFPWIS